MLEKKNCLKNFKVADNKFTKVDNKNKILFTSIKNIQKGQKIAKNLKLTEEKNTTLRCKIMK